MAALLAMYRKTPDPEAFDAYYFGSHVPLAKRIPGLRTYEVSAGGVASAGGESPYHLVARLTFDTLADLQRALVSPEGQATAADLDNFAGAGVELLVFDTREV